MKAIIQSGFSMLPRGDWLYSQVQRRFGALQGQPENRIPQFLRLARLLDSSQETIAGSTFSELGTGHVPIVPICLALCGAKRVHTVDLHRRLQQDLTSDTMHLFLENRARYQELFSEFADSSTLNKGFDLIARHVNEPLTALKKLNIEYVAPMDARNMSISDNSVDFCYSVTVLEHIEPSVLQEILIEEKRIRGTTGRSIHLVDLSDHFAHSDESICRINFLKFSDRQWTLIAGNEFGYCNRLRSNEVESVFNESGLEILKINRVVDDSSLEKLRSGFQVSRKWQHLEAEEICCIQVSIVAN